MKFLISVFNVSLEDRDAYKWWDNQSRGKFQPLRSLSSILIKYYLKQYILLPSLTLSLFISLSLSLLRLHCPTEQYVVYEKHFVAGKGWGGVGERQMYAVPRNGEKEKVQLPPPPNLVEFCLAAVYQLFMETCTDSIKQAQEYKQRAGCLLLSWKCKLTLDENLLY